MVKSKPPKQPNYRTTDSALSTQNSERIESGKRDQTPKKRPAKIPFAGTWVGQLSALGIAALVGAAATAGGNALTTSLQANARSTRASAYIHISSAAYIARNASFPGAYVRGRYEVQGYVLHLAAKQVIWSFNQPVYNPGNAGPIHADPGPCIVSGQNFECNLGVDVSNGQTAYFKIFVAVVTESQANDFAAQKAFGPLDGYSSAAAIPHITSDHTTLSNPPN
jgi:hypothetical protein